MDFSPAYPSSLICNKSLLTLVVSVEPRITRWLTIVPISVACPRHATDGGAVREIDLNEVDPRFAEKLSGLRGTLSSILSEPHSFGRQPVLGGPFLLSLLTEVCERVNQGAKDIVPFRWTLPHCCMWECGFSLYHRKLVRAIRLLQHKTFNFPPHHYRVNCLMKTQHDGIHPAEAYPGGL